MAGPFKEHSHFGRDEFYCYRAGEFVEIELSTDADWPHDSTTIKLSAQTAADFAAAVFALSKEVKAVFYDDPPGSARAFVDAAREREKAAKE